MEWVVGCCFYSTSTRKSIKDFGLVASRFFHWGDIGSTDLRGLDERLGRPRGTAPAAACAVAGAAMIMSGEILRRSYKLGRRETSVMEVQ